MRIAVMGAGGLGGYIGARLAEAGAEVAFIARGPHLSALACHGLTVRSPLGNVSLPMVRATDDPGEIGPVDLVLFTVKLWDTEIAAPATAPLLAGHSRVLSLQNGIDGVEIIARAVTRSQVVAGAAYIAATIASPGVIEHTGGGRKVIVDQAERHDSVMRKFGELCGRSVGIEFETTADIESVLWQKFIRFAAFSAATSLTRMSAGPLLANSETRAFLHQLLKEGVAVAAAAGYPVAKDFADASMVFFASFPETTRSSMATDLERGGRLELNWISGRIHELGRQHGIPTPAHTTAYHDLMPYADAGTALAERALRSALIS